MNREAQALTCLPFSTWKRRIRVSVSVEKVESGIHTKCFLKRAARVRICREGALAAIKATFLSLANIMEPTVSCKEQPVTPDASAHRKMLGTSRGGKRSAKPP